MGCLKLTYRQEEGLEKSVVFLGGSLSKKVQSKKKRDNYYPFGLTFNSFRREDSTPSKYLFNGIERIDDLDLGWDMALYRSYDPAIGRWLQIDPKTSERESPYVGMGNNPIFYSDPLGDTVDIEPVPTPKPDTKPQPAPTPNLEPKPDDGTTNAFDVVIPIPVVEPIVIPTWLVSVTAILRQTLPILSLLTLSGDTPQEKLEVLNYTPPPKALPGFPGAVRVKPKAGRARWKDSNGDILEWDSQHGDVEKYDKTGKNHKGSYSPKSGKQTKPSIKKRKTGN